MHSAPAGFPRSRRLVVSAQFDYVFADPVKSADAYFVALARWRIPMTGGPRLGLAISRKCAARAVDRNRLKRWVRESFRRGWRQWQAHDVDIVVIGRRSATMAERARIAASLDRHWSYLIQRLCASSCSV